MIALAAAVSHVLSSRLRLPLAVFLLAAGVAFGPEGLHWVRPDSLGDLLEPALALAVAIVVFEGAFSLDARTLRLVSPAVRNLVVGGLALTVLAGTLVAHGLVGFPWRLALEFGALISVTGPTVITPILQRVRVNDHVRTTLLGEAVLVDPLGAMAAVVGVQILEAEVLSPAEPIVWVVQRLALGIFLGGAVGIASAAFFRSAVARMESDEVWLVVLGLAVTTFASSEALLAESGLVAVVSLGLILGNADIPHEREVRRYEDAVSILVIAAIFVTLAARLDVDDIRALGPEGLLAVVILVFAVRPVMVLAMTWGAGLRLRERLYVAMIGPRGVVAASFATFVAVRLEGSGVSGGEELVGLVFLTILVSVVVQSAWAAPLASALGVQPLRVIIGGAGRVGQLLARRLTEERETVVLVEADDEAVASAREAGLPVVKGDITHASDLEAAGIKTAKGFVATTLNDKDNLLACQLARSRFGVPEVVSLMSDPENAAAFQEAGIRFMNPVSATVDALDNLLRRPNLFAVLQDLTDRRVVEQTVNPGPALGRRIEELRLPGDTLVMLVRRGNQVIIPHGNTKLEAGDLVTLIGTGEAIEFSRRVIAGEVEPGQAASALSS